MTTMAWFWWIIIVPVGLFVVLWLFVLALWLFGYVTERGRDQYHRQREKRELEEAEDKPFDDNGIHPKNRSPYESDRDE
jgi:hypothetical protein